MYKGTTLIKNSKIEEINRALLDLLKKINELLERIKKLEDVQNN